MRRKQAGVARALDQLQAQRVARAVCVLARVAFAQGDSRATPSYVEVMGNVDVPLSPRGFTPSQLSGGQYGMAAPVR